MEIVISKMLYYVLPIWLISTCPRCLTCKVVQNLLKKTEMTEDEQRQAVAKYIEEAEEMKERYNDMQKHSQAVLAAKLAARRRHKEELKKEAAMKKELQAMSKKQVGYGAFRNFLVHSCFCNSFHA